MYKRRIVLGGAAPAAMLAVGLIAAGPAMADNATPGLAQVPSLVSTASSALSSSVPGLPGMSGVVKGGLPGITSQVPAVSSIPGFGSSANAPQGISMAPANAAQGAAQAAAQGAAQGAAGAGNPGSALGSATGQGSSTLPGLNRVTSRIGIGGQPGSARGNALATLGNAAHSIPALSQATGLLSGLGVGAGGLPQIGG